MVVCGLFLSALEVDHWLGPWFQLALMVSWCKDLYGRPEVVDLLELETVGWVPSLNQGGIVVGLRG
jgi:hypothetical protein